MADRVPLPVEPILETGIVHRYDSGAKVFIMPEYKYFVWKILHRGIRSGRVLDIGTGSGRLAIELAKASGCNFEITGLDLSEDMLKLAEENARAAKVKIDFILATASDLPFPDKSFDLVISYASLHHWFQPIKVFNEIERVTRANGNVIIRDNQRIYGRPFWEVFVWGLSRFMNKQLRENWPKAIQASYTVPELKALLKEAGLENYKIGTDFVKFDVCVESQKAAPKISKKN